MRKAISFVLAITLCFGLCACGKTEAVVAFEALVSEIGAVSLDSESVIVSAESAYDSLADKEKKAAAKSYGILAEKRAEYNAVVAEEVAARIEEVSAVIDAIGKVNLDSKNAIDNARAKYDALTEEEKSLVLNYEILAKAEAEYNEIFEAKLIAEKAKREAEKERLIQEKFEVTTDHVEGISWYNHTTWFWEGYETFIEAYIGTRNNHTWLCLKCNYNSESRWIRWDSISVVADGSRFQKEFGYSSFVRNTSGNRYYEMCEEVLQSTDLAMLRAIANAKEAIVRFNGDYYYFDHFVTESEKECLRDVLSLYDAMIS